MKMRQGRSKQEHTIHREKERSYLDRILTQLCDGGWGRAAQRSTKRPTPWHH